MSVNDDIRNGTRGFPTRLDESTEHEGSQESPQTASTSSDVPRPRIIEEPAAAPITGFATRASIEATEGISKNKLVLLGGALAIAVLFFVFTAIEGKSPKKQTAGKQQVQQAKQEGGKQPKGSVTPVMEAVRAPAPDNANGQLGPGDIRRTRSSDGRPLPKTTAQLAENQGTAKSRNSSLGSIPSFADTQQRWEEPQPYGESPPPTVSQAQQNALKEPSLIFVRAQTQSQGLPATKADSTGDGAPLLEMTPGTRIEAKLETQISSAVQAPVVAVVEYTYAVGDKVFVPAGARVYGQLQQADQSGLIGVKFEEIELLDGAREKIEAIGTGLDLGPIKGSVSGRNTGKNFLVRAASNPLIFVWAVKREG